MELGQFSHEAHDHGLTFYEESEEKLKKIAELSEEEIKVPLCYGCFQTVQGPAYFCESCGDFWLHKSCFDLPSSLPNNSLHSLHPLTLLVKPPSLAGFFVCNGCRDMSPGFAFHCQICRFNLDVKCASPTAVEGLRSRSDHGKKAEIPYFGDEHMLISFNAKKELEKSCTGCQLLLSGPAYGCLDCEFYLHESCKEMPLEIKHQYHPLHPLRAQVAEYGSECDACHMPITKIFYRCNECDFNLHILCANKSLQVRSSLKHKCHEHDLYYFVASYFNEYSLCNACHKICKGSYYLCLECKFYVHVDCVPVPRVVEQDSHCRDYSHSLILKDSFVEDDSGQYYCEVCQRERNPGYHVYHCEQCPDGNPYIAHVECIMSEASQGNVVPQLAEYEFEKNSTKVVEKASEVKPRKQNEEDQNGETSCLALVRFANSEQEKQIKIKDFWHEHILVLVENEDEGGNRNCYWCRKTIFGTLYSCRQCSRHWHTSCAELIHRKTHPLHPQHTVIMLPPGYFDYFICDLCRDICHRIASYHCDQCRFFLDVKCASLTDDHCQELKKTESKTKNFCHKHKLTKGNCETKIKEKCKVCQLHILGPTYCCINCNFFLHESCVETPQEIQHRYHPQHPLRVRDFDGNPKSCRACNLQIWDIAYYCDICEFVLHFTCASYLTSTLKREIHEHTLYSFVAWDLCDQGFIQSKDAQPLKGNFKCEGCGNCCSDSFYRCVECDVNRHLECIPIPLKVKQECHFDPLCLMEKVIEDDSGEYYCEVCEKKRNPNHPVYFCDECEDFMAHIGCVIYEGDTSLEILECWNNYLGSESEETAKNVDHGIALGRDSEQEVDGTIDFDRWSPGITELDQDIKRRRGKEVLHWKPANKRNACL